MITVKKHRLRTLLLCMAVFLMLGGCAPKTEEPLPDFTPLLSDTEEESQSSPMFAEIFYLILPADSSDTFVEHARTLGEALRAKTGIGWRIYTDDMILPPSSDAFEVVLGWADHPQRRIWSEGMRVDDYLCAVSPRAMVLCGRDETTAFLAIERFREAVLPYAELSLLSGMVFYQEGQYEMTEVTLNGVSLGQWSLVCGSDDPWIQECARALQGAICDKSGYLLPILTAKEAPSSDALILRRGEDPLHASLSEGKEGVVLSAADRFGMERAMEYLEGILFSDENGDGICYGSFSEDLLLSATPSVYRLCGLVGGDTHLLGADGLTSISNRVLTDSPDVLLAWELPDGIGDYLMELLFAYDPAEREDGFFGAREDMPAEEKEALCSEEILSVAWIGGKENGFWWVVCRSGADLPTELSETEAPVFVLQCDETAGELGNIGSLSLNELFSQTVGAGETDYDVRGYATDSLRVTHSAEESVVGILSFTVERIG